MRRLLMALMAALLWFASPVTARGGMPNPLTERGKVVEEIYYQIFIAGMIVFIIVFAWLMIVIVRYRANGGKGQATYEKERENLKAEIGWTVVPLIIVLWVGWIAYGGLVELDSGIDNDDTVLEVGMTGYKWFWKASYPEGVEVSGLGIGPNGELDDVPPFVVPADVPILFNITSGDDAIHAFNMQDANGGFVLMHDANPSGPNKYATQAVVLPVGEYLVQCQEHCFNPGHAYMRAKVLAVPMDNYTAWYEETAAGAAAGLQQTFAFEITNDAIGFDELPKVAKGATAVLQFANAGADTTVTVSGAWDGIVAVPSGGLATLEFSADAVGAVSITANGNEATLAVVEPLTYKVDLGAFVIEPANFQLRAGEVYVIEVENQHSALHNFFMGTYSADGTQAIYKSKDLSQGEVDYFIVPAKAAMSFETWCAIPGHYAAGMKGDASIA